MERIKYCWLAVTILIALLMSGCSSTLHICKVTEVNNNQFIVTDGEFLYTFDGESLGSPVKVVKDAVPLQPIESYGESYSLTNIELSRYNGTMDDAAGYYNKLVSEGYRADSLFYTANSLDAKLSSKEGDEIRIVYLGNSTVRILFRNISDLNVFPPYINEGE